MHRGFSPFLQSYKRISTGRGVREPGGTILISQVGNDLAGFGTAPRRTPRGNQSIYGSKRSVLISQVEKQSLSDLEF